MAPRLAPDLPPQVDGIEPVPVSRRLDEPGPMGAADPPQMLVQLASLFEQLRPGRRPSRKENRDRQSDLPGGQSLQSGDGEEGQDDVGLVASQLFETGFDPAGDRRGLDAIDQIVPDIGHQGQCGDRRTLRERPPETALYDSGQPADEEEVAPGSVGAAVPAGGENVDRPRGAPSDLVHHDRQGGPEVARPEEDGPQYGLALGHPLSLPRTTRRGERGTGRRYRRSHGKEGMAHQ